MAKKDWMVTESMLDDYQIRVMQATLEKSCIVSGCAGSGKSVLALIKAQRIQKEKGNNYKIIVFTKSLSKYMNSGRKELGLENDFYYHWEWKKRYNCPPADYIIVDEIQDFTQEEVQEFINATNKNFFFFGDTAQSIFDGMGGKQTIHMDEIRGMASERYNPKEFELYANHRLPIPIARITQKYIGVGLDGYDENVYQSTENKMPIFLKCDNFQQQIQTIVQVIKDRNLVDVGILLPHNEDVEVVSGMLDKLEINHEKRYWKKNEVTGDKKDIDTLNFTSTNPKIMTYHSSKGLQFESVFLPKIQPLSSMHEISDQKALYVAMTRSYRDLFVMYSGVLPYPLSEVSSELYKTSLIDEVEDI